MPASNLLREATATAHKAAEVRLDAASILDGSLKIEGFAAMVQLHYGVWSAVASWWPEGDDVNPAASRFLKNMVQALRQDLNALGLSAVPGPDLKLDPNAPGARYGALYVLRGSTLGGTMINRKLKDCDALAGHSVFHFHGACEALPGKEWPAFLREMNAAVHTDDELTDAVAGAEAVFGLYLSAGG